jgi:acyl-coenzyme A thioesterase PaaI-like protein
MREPTAAASGTSGSATQSRAAAATGAGAAQRIRRLWDRLSPRPGGKRIFSWLVGRTAPYTGTIGARVEALGEGHARLTLRDRRKVRNHLRSVHAVAQLNLAEEASGLAVTYSMPLHLRGIPVRLEIDYLKKARGTITAVCDLPGPVPEPQGDERTAYEAQVVLTDPAGDVVARAVARWVIGR